MQVAQKNLSIGRSGFPDSSRKAPCHGRVLSTEPLERKTCGVLAPSSTTFYSPAPISLSMVWLSHSTLEALVCPFIPQSCSELLSVENPLFSASLCRKSCRGRPCSAHAELQAINCETFKEEQQRNSEERSATGISEVLGFLNDSWRIEWDKVVFYAANQWPQQLC